VPEMQMCHPQDPQNRHYYLVVTELQLPRPRTWPAWQTEHAGREGRRIQRKCDVVVAADALHRRLDHRNRRTSGKMIRRRIVPWTSE